MRSREMRRIDYYVTVVIFVSIAFLCGPIVAGGQFVEVGLQVSGSGTVTQNFVTDIDWDDVYANPNSKYTWNLTKVHPNGITVDLGTHTAKIENISVAVKADPRIELGFSAVSDDGATDFLFTSDVLGFDPLTSVDAYVYAEAGSLPGTVVSDVEFPGKLFRGLYNDTEIFADIVDPFSFVQGGVSDYYAASIPGEVSSMQIMWSLNVNSGGHASGLSVFELSGEAIPEPASVLLLGLGGLVLRRKRRL